MNQDKLNYFLKFSAAHTPVWSKPRPNGSFDYCGVQECRACVHIKAESDCRSTFIYPDELEYLKLNYPEHFI